MKAARLGLLLILPRLAIMHRINGGPRELRPNIPLAEGENELWAQRASMEVAFDLGERIALTPDQLGGVFLGCFFLAADILERLPRPPEPILEGA